MSIELVQGSLEWLQARAGSLGASQVADALAKLKGGGWGSTRATVKAQLVVERITGRPTETYCSPAMQRGKDLEPQALAMYSFRDGHEVAAVGLVKHPAIAGSHCSPDGLCGADGMVEIKCCLAPRHIEVLTGSPPEDRYVKQCHWQMACTGRQWVDLAYFNPDFPGPMQLVVHRIERNDAVLIDLEDQVSAFLAEVAATVADLEARYMVREAA